MKRFFLNSVLVFSLSMTALSARGKNPEIEKKYSSEQPLQSLYSALDPLSISQHLAFYELYPDQKEGQAALKHVWELLNNEPILNTSPEFVLPKFDIQGLISLVNRQSFDPPVKLNDDQLNLIERVSSRLSNRKLKGNSVWTKEEVLSLSPDEIDLARGLLIDQFEGSPNIREEIRQYEANLDLMALQILVRLPKNPTHRDKIREMNRFVFHEMQFRFPPHSLYAKDIDLYTFLPSVIDSRQGVCLGVSILYLSLSQRLDLPLEVITPPGHIYVRYCGPGEIINIETTARGINLPSEVYLSINNRKLQLRNIKEVIGMAFINQASVTWGRGDYATTVNLYEKALPYVPDDPLLKMFLGMNYLFVGKKKQGTALLKEIQGMTFEEAVSAETLPDDFLQGRIDIEGMKAIFLPVDETRESILKKQKELEKILSRYPHYRAGLLQLATTWLQLGRATEAQTILEKYHRIDSKQSTVEYYLAIIAAQRLDYNLAWDYLKNAETLVKSRNHYPKALESLRNQLRHTCPE